MIRTGALSTKSSQLKARAKKARMAVCQGCKSEFSKIAMGQKTCSPQCYLKSGKKLRGNSPKMTPIRKSAKGEECDISLPMVCNNDFSTVVWCHENSYAAGKGMGLKARDECGAYGCSACHAVYDGQRPRPEGMSKEYVDQRFYEAMIKSGEKLKRKGLI